MLTVLRHTWKPILFMLLGAFLALLVALVLILNSKPDLSPWHTVELGHEFTADSSVDTFEGYLALEERLFRELDEQIIAAVPEAQRSEFSRYTRGSQSDPTRWERNWNRSFELAQKSPTAGFLLVHGMSDSPYSLRNLGQRLHAAGGWVVGMRMPGHGTAPAELTHTTWEDMVSAVRLGVRHVRERIGERPLFLVGYSNGGALAVHYALETLADEGLPRVQGLVLLSPMIGVTPAAGLAIWQERLGGLLGLDKLAWTGVAPEYDPFKYMSFPINAGIQSYRLTHELARRFEALRGTPALSDFPPVLAFQSAADATVSAPDLISALMGQLPEGVHELVLFDVNRRAESVDLLEHDPGPELAQRFESQQQSFTLSLVANQSATERAVILRRIRPGEQEPTEVPLGLQWPELIFSLSHVALPFPPSDPLYGNGSGEASPGIRLGNLAARGERGVLRVPPGDMLRLRWNPFYSYVERRILEFAGLEPR